MLLRDDDDMMPLHDATTMLIALMLLMPARYTYHAQPLPYADAP